MNQFDKEKHTLIGFVQKPHGLKGEVIVVLEKEFEQSIDSAAHFFIGVEGGLVPFFVGEDGIKYRTSDSAIIKFDYINDQSKAKELAGCKIYLSDEDLSWSENREDFDQLKGMTVIDQRTGELGSITRIDDFSGNIVITVNHPQAEVMIPLSDQIITKIDQKRKKIYLDCPEGLIDIYLQ